MKTLAQLLENNRKWAAAVAQSDPAFFRELARQQSPDVLWIGCSDSRVPASTILGLPPGALFVHRNIANLVADVAFELTSVEGLTYKRSEAPAPMGDVRSYGASLGTIPDFTSRLHGRAG